MYNRPLEETTEERPPETEPANIHVTPAQPAAPVPPPGEGDLIGDLLSLDLPSESSYNAPPAAAPGGQESHGGYFRCMLNVGSIGEKRGNKKKNSWCVGWELSNCTMSPCFFMEDSLPNERERKKEMCLLRLQIGIGFVCCEAHTTFCLYPHPAPYLLLFCTLCLVLTEQGYFLFEFSLK